MSTYGPLRYDLTPDDLLVGGYVIRAHRTEWVWWQRNPYGSGEIYGAPYATVAEAVASARWLLTGKRVAARQASLFEEMV